MPFVRPFRLAWWNTSLAPRGVSRGNAGRYATAARVLHSLFDTEAIDLLAVGETTPADLAACIAASGKLGARQRWRTPRPQPRGSRATSVGVIYNPRRLIVVEDELITDSSGRKTVTTGWRLVLQTHDGEDALNAVIVHWPSHVREDAGIDRRDLAGSLRRAFRNDRDVVFLGDFNDEPFSQSISESLRAYRDRELVRHHKDAYYNPFWRLLGEQQHLEAEGENRPRLPAGTHFYRSGYFSRWFTFDQIIVSSALIGESSWRLVESATRVVAHDALLTRNGAMVDCFDHLPIATSLTYTPEDHDG
jgi:hypothetical protein